MNQYENIYARTTSKLTRDYHEKTNNDLRNMIIHRRLCHAITTSNLNKFYHDEMITTNKNNLEKWLKKYKIDNEIILYWRWIKMTNKLNSFLIRDEFAHVILTNAIKLCFFVHLMYNLCKFNDRKILMFCDWFFDQWLIEITLQNLSFRTLMIRVKHKFSKRVTILKKFNDKKNDVNVFVINIKLFNLNQNMQKNCFDVIFFDTWIFVFVATQKNDRVHRIDQTRICIFYTINLNHLYDQIMQINAIKKMLDIFESMNIVKITFDEIETFKSTKSKKTTNFTNDMIKTRLIFQKIDQLYLIQYDIRNSKTKWNNVRDLIEKNFFSMKTKFRKRFRLKTFFIRHVFNRFVEIVDEIFKKRVRYDADMLFINDIFFVYFVDMHVNKRQIESKQKLKTIVKTSIKKMRRIKRKTRQTTK